MKQILIIGAAGFIGSHVCKYFCKQGYKPTCFIKASSSSIYLDKLPVRIIRGDICDLNTLRNAMQNVHTIINLAARCNDWGAYSEFHKSNVNGNLNILKAGKETGVQYFILTGSISSYGEENSLKVKNEDYPDNSHYPYFMNRLFPSRMNYYRDTKALGTQKAVDYAHKEQLNSTILEPTWVYGEREFNTGFYSYLKTIKSGIPFFPGRKSNKFHVIYIRDLARAYYCAFEKKLTGVNRIIIGNRQSESMQKTLSTFCTAIGKTKPLNLPKFFSYPLAFTLELIWTLARIKKPPLLTRGRVNLFYDNIEYSTLKAQKLLSFTNQYGIEEGIERTVRWYKMQHLI